VNYDKDRANRQKKEVYDTLYEFMKDRLGPDRAVTLTELTRQFRIPERTLRLALRDLVRHKHLPIVSFSGDHPGMEGIKGFFVASEKNHVDVYVRGLIGRTEAIKSRIRDINNAYRRFPRGKNA
jgi:hypothetical protein